MARTDSARYIVDRRRKDGGYDRNFTNTASGRVSIAISRLTDPVVSSAVLHDGLTLRSVTAASRHVGMVREGRRIRFHRRTQGRSDYRRQSRRACNAERSTTQPQVSDSADLAINKTDYSQSTNTYTRFGARDVTVSLSATLHATPWENSKQCASRISAR